MITAPEPFDEALRLEELYRLELLDSAAEPEFDDFVELAQLIAGAQIALVSLIDIDRQWFKACVGLDVSETPRTQSFCAHAILQDQGVMWIEDARRDIRFVHNPLVTSAPNIRFYAGAPITVRGSKIGTLCVIDPAPKAWDGAIANQLAKLAKILGARIEARSRLRTHAHSVETAPCAIIRANEDGLIDLCNGAAQALLGRPASSVIGRSLRQVLPNGDEAREDRQYRLLVAEVEDYAIYMLDPQGLVTNWNAGARRIKGYEALEVIGQSFGLFYTKEEQAAGAPQRALRLARVNGRFEDEGWRVRKDGSRLWASVVIEAIYDGGVFVGFAKITRDISERHEADAVLKDALHKAEEANRAKSEFLANMSHEIRTPLNGVVAVADMLVRRDLPASEREMAGIIASSAQNLERLLGDILDLARIESGQVVITPEPFDLVAAVESVAGLARLKAEEKGLSFSLDCGFEQTVEVVGDKLRIQQILTNLLSNAVKFTTAGAVSLTLAERGADEDGQVTFEFAVRDSGVGFDPSRKDLVFGRFSQADGSITRRFGGTGLGMAISQQLSEIMGGVLYCDSTPGIGSVFTFRIPLAVREVPTDIQDDGMKPADASVGSVDRPIRVLLVDDHPTNRKVCELILAQVDADVTSVENGALAVEAFLQCAFDLILMDMQMPVMDGLTAVRHIRDHERAARLIRTPIFMLTANALGEHVAQGREAGADYHIAKPITSASIFGALSLLQELQDAEPRTTNPTSKEA